MSRKRLVGVVAMVAVFLTWPVVAFGNALFNGFQTVDVIVNGRPLQSDVPAINFYGRTLLPVRAVAEAVGFQVTWNAATNTATLDGLGPEQIRELSALNSVRGSMNFEVRGLLDNAQSAEDVIRLYADARPLTSTAPEWWASMDGRLRTSWSTARKRISDFRSDYDATKAERWMQSSALLAATIRNEGQLTPTQVGKKLDEMMAALDQGWNAAVKGQSPDAWLQSAKNLRLELRSTVTDYELYTNLIMSDMMPPAD